MIAAWYGREDRNVGVKPFPWEGFETIGTLVGLGRALDLGLGLFAFMTLLPSVCAELGSGSVRAKVFR